MARSVFFSFHYQPDIMRVQVIKQHHLTKGSYTAAGFFDGSLEEKAQREGDGVVQGMIDRGLPGSTVLCVLIGAETFSRRWVHYEIFKSIQLGMGVFGVRIHQIVAPKVGISTAGPNPFVYLGYGSRAGKLHPMINYQDGWKDAPYQTSILASNAPYLPTQGAFALNSLFPVYDWTSDNGFQHFEEWVERAARQAGK